MSYTNVSKLGTSSIEWIKSLDFYKDDLDILDKRLLEVAGKNTGKEIGLDIEHYQNQFIIQRKTISHLKHQIHQYDLNVESDVKNHAGRVEEEVKKTHEEIGQEMKEFEVNMKMLRSEFNQFLSKWM